MVVIFLGLNFVNVEVFPHCNGAILTVAYSTQNFLRNIFSIKMFSSLKSIFVYSSEGAILVT